MIYYNESVIMNESGFDTVDAIMECPIYDRYNDMISSISEFGFISESQKIEFRILEENVFETIGNALKKAWKAIADFFRGLAGRISGFFKKISTKKIKDAVDKSIEKKEEEVKQVASSGNEEQKRKILKRIGIDVDKLSEDILNKDNDGNIVNYAPLNVEKLVKDNVHTGGYNNMKKLFKKLESIGNKNIRSEIKSNEYADKAINMLNQIKLDDSAKVLKISSKEVKNKINECMEIGKVKSLLSSDVKDGYLLPKGQKKFVKYFYELSNVNLIKNNDMQKLYYDVANFADHMSKTVEVNDKNKKDLNKEGKLSQYDNKVANVYIKKHKELLASFNNDKNGLYQISNATLKAYKDSAKIIMKFGTKDMKKVLGRDEILKPSNESYDPWTGLEESYDPWAGLEESYDPWDDLY